MSQHPTDLFRTSCGAIAPLELNVSGPGFAGGERRVFEQPFVLVGRDERSCLRLEDGAVSRRHAYLQQLGSRVFCVDLGSRTGIRWGGELRPAGWLRPEQGIQIGPFTVEPARAAQAEEAPGDGVAEDWDPLQDRANDPRILPRITVEVGNEVLSRLCMNRVLVLVGSSPACRVRLRDARVSRYHCSLVRTPQGVWLVDLLHGSGACLNGQSLRWALVKEGDRLQVGPYVLRVWYPNVRTETPPLGLVEIPARTPVQPAVDTSKSGLLPSQDPGGLEPAATEMSVVVSALQTELGERQRDVEVFRQQLGDRQAECDRLGAHVRGLETQVAEMAGLQARLEASEASVRELDAVRGERDRWQTEAQNLQASLTADSADHEEQLGRLTADLQTAQGEGHRLQTEQQSCRHAAEQAGARVADLERALTEAAAQATALDEARVGWELERQALEARLELERQSHDGAVQAAVREVQARAAAERQEWQLRLEATQQQLVGEREAVHAVGARLDQESAILQEVRADLAARNAEHGATLQRLQEIQNELSLLQHESSRLQVELDQAQDRQRDVETLRQQLVDVRAEHGQLCARVPELEGRANSADHLSARLRDEEAESERLRVQLRAAESQQAELEPMRAESDRLGAHVRGLEVQVAEMATLQTRLEASEASIRELDAVRGERDRWQTETQNLQASLTADSADHEEQLGRLTADLQEAQAERDRLQLEQQSCRQSAEQLVSALQAELDKAREHQQDVEVFRQQLGDRQAECDRLGAHVRGLETQVAEMAGLQARLETSEASVRELDAVRGERDRWQTEAQNLQASLTADSADHEEQLGRLTADLQEAQAEGHRLQTEQQSGRNWAEQAGARVADLERALSEATAAQATALDEARVGWELERQALEAALERERQSHDGAVQAAVREVQARAATERLEWQLRLEGAEQQIVWERGMFREQSEQIRQQAAKLQAERDRLAARIAQAELRLRAAQQSSPDEAGHAAELHNQRQQAAREQVFVQLSGIRLGHLLPQSVRAQHPAAPAEQADPRAPLVRDRASVEEQYRLTAIAQEVEAAWGEAAVGQEQLPANFNPSRRVGGQASEREKAVEQRSAPVVPPLVPANEEEACAPSDTPPSSAAPLEESQPSEDVPDCLPQRKDSRPESRPRLWRRFFGFVLGK